MTIPDVAAAPSVPVIHTKERDEVVEPTQLAPPPALPSLLASFPIE